MQRDLVKCGIEEDWCELAQDRSAWRGVVDMRVNTINKETEWKEDRKKDERKRTQQLVSYPDCFRRLHFIYGEKGSAILPMQEFFHPRNHKYAND